MAQITIKTSKEHRFNKGVIIGEIEVKFDKYGMCEIPERYLEDILNNDSSISLVDEADVKKYAQITKETKETKGKKEQIPIDVIEINNQMKIDNNKLTETNKILIKELDLSKAEVIRLNSIIDEFQGQSEVTEEDIDKMSKSDLLDFCEVSEFPKEDWEDIKKLDKLKVYAKGKLSEKNEVSIDEMDKEGLRALCVECEFTNDEWESLEVEDLKVYVKDKIEKSQE